LVVILREAEDPLLHLSLHFASAVASVTVTASAVPRMTAAGICFGSLVIVLSESRSPQSKNLHLPLHFGCHLREAEDLLLHLSPHFASAVASVKGTASAVPRMTPAAICLGCLVIVLSESRNPQSKNLHLPLHFGCHPSRSGGSASASVAAFCLCHWFC
jgi:hypothetical protein